CVGGMASVCSVGLVLVEFGYEYISRDGFTVSIKPNERYTLLAKTNNHWWHVRKDEHSKPFYVPAKYVKELPPSLPSPLDFAGAPGPESRPPVPDLAEKAKPNEVTIRLRSPGNRRKTENRMSTFGVPLDIREPPSYLHGGLADSLASLHPAPIHTPTPDAMQQQKKRLSLAPSLLFGSRGITADDTLQKARVPGFGPADPLPRRAEAVEPPLVKNLKETRQQGLPPKPEPLLLPEEEPSEEPTPSPDTENIYESILDLKLEDLVNTETGPAGLHESTTSTPPSAPQAKLGNEDPTTAVYANVTELKKVTSLSEAAALPASGPGREVRIDQDGGKAQQSDRSEALAPSRPTAGREAAPASASAGLSEGSDWEQVLDETTGRHYYYNPTLQQTSWEAPELLFPTLPPLPKEDYPADEHESQSAPHPSKDVPQVKHAVLPRVTLDPASPVPAGWTCTTEPGGKNVFTSEHTEHQWIQSKDDKGNPYYYSRDGSMSIWTLPEVCVSVFTFVGFTGQIASLLEKAGILNKTKVADNGKKLRKNWTQSWTVLHGGILTFHKDPKSTSAGIVSKTNQIVPEYTVELKGAVVGWASKEKSSKKNVLELKTRHGSEYLIQYDTDSIIHDWHKIIQDTIRHLDHDHYSEDEEDEVMEKSPHPADREKKIASARQSSTSAADTEQGRVRTKLRKFLQRRPTLQSVKEKGYIKDNVFGCHLDTLCHRENTTVPRFVEKCIKVVERRGLNIDGIYRVSGNLAVIQKLRYNVDREEDLDLDDGQWEEIHVITGALKLFFRELPEPLFPYSFFEKFIAAIKINDYSQKVSYMQDLVRNLPLPNHNTMEVLFRHLRKVIEHGESNRMSVQSMAIVFGPTLLRPEEEAVNITVYMVFQNQIVELILNEFNEVFRPR
uniref:Rho GTPase activating protein 27 n=1 Tax=Electrophorus electricus TaxID=8005 RepID=A0A4W4GEG9_ELEEL